MRKEGLRVCWWRSNKVMKEWETAILQNQKGLYEPENVLGSQIHFSSFRVVVCHFTCLWFSSTADLIMILSDHTSKQAKIFFSISSMFLLPFWFSSVFWSPHSPPPPPSPSSHYLHYSPISHTNKQGKQIKGLKYSKTCKVDCMIILVWMREMHLLMKHVDEGTMSSFMLYSC